MKILTVSVGRPAAVEFGGRSFDTSIFKRPIGGATTMRERNIDGDRQADLSVHGGRDKAVYVYSQDYYPEWAAELGRDLEPAQFGENLTVSGGTDDVVVLGSRYALGDAVVEVTQPRVPCFKLGARLGDATFPHRFWQAGRLGFYLRVEREGTIEPGMALRLLEAPAHGITVRDLYGIVQERRAAAAARALELLPHLDEGLRRRLRQAVRAG